jgi:hypothetical protein
MGEPARSIGSAEVRRVLQDLGGDLRAAGEKLGLSTQEILMILAYDITVTATNNKTRGTATGVFEVLSRDTDV